MPRWHLDAVATPQRQVVGLQRGVSSSSSWRSCSSPRRPSTSQPGPERRPSPWLPNQHHGRDAGLALPAALALSPDIMPRPGHPRLRPRVQPHVRAPAAVGPRGLRPRQAVRARVAPPPQVVLLRHHVHVPRPNVVPARGGRGGGGGAGAVAPLQVRRGDAAPARELLHDRRARLRPRRQITTEL